MISVSKTESIGVCPFDPSRVGVAFTLEGEVDARWKMAFWQESPSSPSWDDRFDLIAAPSHAFDAIALEEKRIVVWVLEGDAERAIERVKAHVERANALYERLRPAGEKRAVGELPGKSR